MRTLSDQLEVFEQITSSPNFLLILVGAAIWFIGYFAWLVSPLITVSGFALTLVATAQASMSRPITFALPGFLLGGIIQIAGYYILTVPIVGWIVGPMLIVFGGVLLLFYGFSIALQRIDIPVVKNLEDFLEAQQKKQTTPKSKLEDEIVDVDEEPSEEDTESIE